jgi:hypothetical protein
VNCNCRSGWGWMGAAILGQPWDKAWKVQNPLRLLKSDEPPMIGRLATRNKANLSLAWVRLPAKSNLPIRMCFGLVIYSE